MLRNRHSFVLTMVNRATRHPNAVALRYFAQEVPEKLVEIFSRCGISGEILSYRSTSFASDLIEEVSRPLSVK